MKSWMMAAATLLAVGLISSASAEELTSGVEVGGRITSYKGTKTAGIEDGVDAGKSLCYT